MEITLTIYLTNADYAVVGRHIASIAAQQALYGQPMDWTIERSLNMLLWKGIDAERRQQHEHDALQRRMAQMPPAPPPPPPPPPEYPGFEPVPVPEWLAEKDTP